MDSRLKELFPMMPVINIRVSGIINKHWYLTTLTTQILQKIVDLPDGGARFLFQIFCRL